MSLEIKKYLIPIGKFEHMAHPSCHDVHHFNDITSQCVFVRNNTDCQEVQGFINYIEFVFCAFSSIIIPMFISFIWLILLFIIIGRTADDFFCPALDVIAKFFKLSHNVAGVTFLAFGNGAPDIFSSLAGISQMRPELVIGALFGAGIFVITIVAGSIILVAPFDMMQRPFLRDVIFYLIAVFWTFNLFYTGKITLFHSIGFILLYIVYLILVLVGHYVYQKWLKPNTLLNLIKSNSLIVITVATPGGSVICENDEKEPENYFWRRRRSSARQNSNNSSRSNSLVSINSLVSNNTDESTISSVVSEPIPAVMTTNTLDVPKTPNMSEHTPLIAVTAACSALSLVSENQSETKRFFQTLSPIDIDLWPHLQSWQKCLHIIAFPFILILKLTIPVVDHDKHINNWCRSLTITNILIIPIFFCFALGYGTYLIGEVFPLSLLIVIISVVLSILLFKTSCNNHPPVYHVVCAFFGFGSSVIWIYFISNEIVSILKMVGIVMHLSDVILGLTILAWGNSLPDLVADVSLAKQNLPRMGMSGCFGGPLFNLLIGIGVPFTIITLKSENRMILVKYYTSTSILTIFMLLSLISSLVIVPLMVLSIVNELRLL
uniref:Sodium/calcium exchanger membrane region domain-containing protein n=1 Tax=Strigamia maritima TaxID=126957 RepID=T1J5C7_STRMM